MKSVESKHGDDCRCKACVQARIAYIADRAWTAAKNTKVPARGNAPGVMEDDGGPWLENAVRCLEDVDNDR